MPRKKKEAKTVEEPMYKDALEEIDAKQPNLKKKAESGSRAAAIRRKCFDCVNGCHPGEVRKCPVYDCPLWMYRTGKKTPLPNKAVKE